jgi:hypothetical protein
MSEETIKIQTTPAVPAGAETPMSNDDNRKSTHGGTFNQDTLSFCRGTNVEGSTARLVSPAANNREPASVSGLAVDSPIAVSVKPVDRRTLEGSTPGDFRTQAAPAAMPANPGPRQNVGQFKGSKFDGS